MTLLSTILKKVMSSDSINRSNRSNTSPPPEIQLPRIKKKKSTYKYGYVKAKVDTSAPILDPRRPFNLFESWVKRHDRITAENMMLMLNIKRMHYQGGKVDCKWGPREMPPPIRMYYDARVNFYNHVHNENKRLYEIFRTTVPRVDTAENHRHDWIRNRKAILQRAQMKFVLFPPVPQEDIEDNNFKAPPGIQRTRAFITIGVQNGAQIGTLQVELFTEICPETCKLFLELLLGDGMGYSYVGTHFFRKVPNLFWSGGDVIFNNGFGCYAQKGRLVPIGAENYHFSHSMPGLLSMRVTPDNETCGIFNITFKALPQFDIKSVVFGRVVRPSEVYNCITTLGKPLSKRPIIEIVSTKAKINGEWVYGSSNKNFIQLPPKRIKRSKRFYY